MSTTVQQVVNEARALIHDGYANHTIVDTVTAQATGTATIFKLNNQNVVQVADGAPTNLQALVNGSVVSVSSVNETAGLVTLDSAPTAGSQVQMLYYFTINSDAEYLTFCKSAERFANGITPQISAMSSLMDIPDTLIAAATNYAAYLAATAAASLSHWYYNSSAGGKTFDKASIAQGWAEQAKELLKEAEGAREDAYRRWDQAKAPAMALGYYYGVGGPRGDWTPRR